MPLFSLPEMRIILNEILILRRAFLLLLRTDYRVLVDPFFNELVTQDTSELCGV